MSAPAWDLAERQKVLERFRQDMARREELSPRQKSVLDGIHHALRPDSMDPAYAHRHLLDYTLGSGDSVSGDVGSGVPGRIALDPGAVVAVGTPEEATHLTWQVSGMGISVQTAMWGSAREAAQLQTAQREAGAPRPCVVAWLGYTPPGPWGVLTGAGGLRGGTHLAQHLLSWFQAVESGRLPRVHTAVEAHSFGSLVAARALQILHRAHPPREVDALVVAGPVGLPPDLAGHPEQLGVPADRVFLAQTRTDWVARLGRLFSGRRPWTRYTPLPVEADPERGLAAAVGHNTSRFRPDARLWGRGHGYRDVGTASLYWTARATTGLGDPRAEGPRYTLRH